MAIVGSIVVGMIAQTDKFIGPMQKAGKALTSFGKDFGSFLAGPVGRLESVLGTVGRTIAGTFEGIDKTGDAADRIGTTTAALQELRYAAKLTGSETESLDTALLKFSANLGDAANSAVAPAAKALEKLKLDPEALAEQDITVAFGHVSDAIKTVGTDAQKNAILMDLFGKGGVQIANTMKAGSGEISRFAAEFRAMGGSVTETSRQQVAAMMDSIDRAKAALTGIGTQVGVALSPFIDEAAQQFVGLASAGEGVGVIVSAAMDKVLRAVAAVADFAQGARNVFIALEMVTNKVFVAIINAAATLARALDALLKATTGYTTGIGDALSTFAVENEKTGAAFRANLMKTFGDESWGDKFRKTADSVVAKSKEMADRVAESNKKSTQAVNGFTVSQENSDKAARKALADYAARAKAIFDEVQTPLEKFQDKLGDIETALKGGAIDSDIANRAISKAQGEFQGEKKFGGALESGSVEARSAILRAITGGDGKKDKVEQNTGDMAATLKRIEDIQRKTMSKPEPEVSLY